MPFSNKVNFQDSWEFFQILKVFLYYINIKKAFVGSKWRWEFTPVLPEKEFYVRCTLSSTSKDDITFSWPQHFLRNICFIIKTLDAKMTVKQTCHFSFEWAAHDVLWPAVFNGDEIVARCHGCVDDFVAFGTLATIHLDFGWPVNVDW